MAFPLDRVVVCLPGYCIIPKLDQLVESEQRCKQQSRAKRLTTLRAKVPPPMLTFHTIPSIPNPSCSPNSISASKGHFLSRGRRKHLQARSGRPTIGCSSRKGRLLRSLQSLIKGGSGGPRRAGRGILTEKVDWTGQVQAMAGNGWQCMEGPYWGYPANMQSY